MPSASQTADLIVLGTGGVGSAALWHAARRGLRVLGIDRFPPAHARGSSHGKTRIIRQAYFEHPDYVPLLKRAYRQWRELEQASGQTLYQEVGVLQIGPPDGIVVPGVLDSAARHGLNVELLLAAEIQARYPYFTAPPNWQGVLEREAGYLRVEACVQAHLNEALRQGATLQTGETVVGWSANDRGAAVQTDRGSYSAAKLIVAAGAWSGPLLKDLHVPLEVRRVPQLWLATDDARYRADRGCPAYLFETPSGVFYGFPVLDEFGLKCAQHGGGQVISDPLAVDRSLWESDRATLAAFLAAHLPGVSSRVIEQAVCMYTMSSDEHFLVDRHPAHAAVCFAAGLSGHGFKFTNVLGEALVDLSVTGTTSLPMEFLSLARFGSP